MAGNGVPGPGTAVREPRVEASGVCVAEPWSGGRDSGSGSAPARMPGPSTLVRSGAGGSGSGHVATAAVINTADMLL